MYEKDLIMMEICCRTCERCLHVCGGVAPRYLMNKILEDAEALPTTPSSTMRFLCSKCENAWRVDLTIHRGGPVCEGVTEWQCKRFGSRGVLSWHFQARLARHEAEPRSDA